MASSKPRIVIIGAGMAGLTAANKLYANPKSKHLFELSVVEGGARIGGRISSSHFCGDRIEEGATWIHGIEGNPIYKIAQETNSLHSDQPWELMDGFFQNDPITVVEGGHELDPSFVQPISRTFENLTNFIRGKAIDESDSVSCEVLKRCKGNFGSVGSFLRKGLEAYLDVTKDGKDEEKIGNWSRKSLKEAVFAMHETTESAIAATDDLYCLDYKAESEYPFFPGEEIGIARGYSSVINHLASVLPVGMIQLGRKVEKIEWQPNGGSNDSDSSKPVKLHFGDGSILSADHVIVTVSLGVLKHGIGENSGLFDPPLPSNKTEAISRLGFGFATKVFVQLNQDKIKFPFLQMVFHKPDSEFRSSEIPNWIRRTTLLYPIYNESRVLMSWYAGKEAREVESLSEDEIGDGISTIISNLFRSGDGKQLRIEKVLRSKWGTNPLFLGAYSYVAVGSSLDDMDILAEPLPEERDSGKVPKLQILFAGEATHRTYYSTTHGAYFSGLREADRLLEYYNCNGEV